MEVLESNAVRLSGVLVEIDKPRYSPAGTPHQSLLLEHQSKQMELDRPRLVKLSVRLSIKGKILLHEVEKLKLGDKVQVEGFLSAPKFTKYRQPELLLNVQVLGVLEIA